MSQSKEPDPERARRVAEEGCILRAVVGSTVHGLAQAGTDDRDEMGVCIEPPEYVVGLRPFEHWVLSILEAGTEAPHDGQRQEQPRDGDWNRSVMSPEELRERQERTRRLIEEIGEHLLRVEASINRERAAMGLDPIRFAETPGLREKNAA